MTPKETIEEIQAEIDHLLGECNNRQLSLILGIVQDILK